MPGNCRARRALYNRVIFVEHSRFGPGGESPQGKIILILRTMKQIYKQRRRFLANKYSFRHCERRDATQSTVLRTLGCFAVLAMTTNRNKNILLRCVCPGDLHRAIHRAIAKLPGMLNNVR